MFNNFRRLQVYSKITIARFSSTNGADGKPPSTPAPAKSFEFKAATSQLNQTADKYQRKPKSFSKKQEETETPTARMANNKEPKGEIARGSVSLFKSPRERGAKTDQETVENPFLSAFEKKSKKGAGVQAEVPKAKTDNTLVRKPVVSQLDKARKKLRLIEAQFQENIKSLKNTHLFGSQPIVEEGVAAESKEVLQTQDESVVSIKDRPVELLDNQINLERKLDHFIQQEQNAGRKVDPKLLKKMKENIANDENRRVHALSASFEHMVSQLRKNKLIDAGEPSDKFHVAIEEAIQTKGVEFALSGLSQLLEDNFDFKVTKYMLNAIRKAIQKEQAKVGAPIDNRTFGSLIKTDSVDPNTFVEVIGEVYIDRAIIRALKDQYPREFVKAIVNFNKEGTEENKAKLIEALNKQQAQIAAHATQMATEIESLGDGLTELASAEIQAIRKEMGMEVVKKGKMSLADQEDMLSDYEKLTGRVMSVDQDSATSGDEVSVGVETQSQSQSSDIDSDQDSKHEESELKFKGNGKAVAGMKKEEDNDINEYGEPKSIYEYDTESDMEATIFNDEKGIKFIRLIQNIMIGGNQPMSRKEIDEVVTHLKEIDPELSSYGTKQVAEYPENEAIINRMNSRSAPILSDLSRVSLSIPALGQNQKVLSAQAFYRRAQVSLSPENKLLQTKFALDRNPLWKVFVAEVMANTESHGKSLLLERLFKVMNGLDQPMYQDHLIGTVVDIAKFNNKFGTSDKYMRTFAKIMMQGPETQDIARKLEVLLNSEIAIKRQEKPVEVVVDMPALQANVIAQGEFQYLTAAQKMLRIQEFKTMKHELQKTREMKDMLQNAGVMKQAEMVASFESIDNLLKQIDVDSAVDPGQLPVFYRMQKTSFAINELIERVFVTDFGINGIKYDSIEQVYNQALTGHKTVAQTRDYLIERGMSDQLAGQLMQKFIDKVQATSDVVSLIDLFSCPKAKALINKAPLDEIYTNYVNLHGTQTQRIVGDLYQQSRYKPIRPMGIPGRMMFSTLFQDVQAKQGNFAKALEEKKYKAKRSKFMEFIDEAEKIDDEVASENFEFDADNLDIGFERTAEPDGGRSAFKINLATDAASPLAMAASQRKSQSDTEKLIQKAKKKYNKAFFNKFTFTGDDSLALTQQALEQHILKEKDMDEVRLLCLSIINSAYQVNDIIPNIEMMFYKMFCSPMTTKEIRKGNENLLEGNLFLREGMNLGPTVYRSLMETVALYPKKKHFKKIIQHMIQYEDRDNVDPAMLELLVFIGIDQKYPVLMGQTMKYLLQNDYAVTPAIFKEFMLFLERCKGFEEDAKKFVIMTAETQNVQVDYDLLRPMFIRTIQNKTGPEVLKLFEQFRKSLKLNKAWHNKPQDERNEKLKEIKCGIYDGLVKDLLAVKAYTLCQVVYSEKMREKFEVSMQDHLTGLEIYAVQKKLDQYQVKFREVLHTTDEKIIIDQQVCEELGRTLQYFDSQEYQKARLDMTEDLQTKIIYDNIFMSSKLFDSLVYVYTESQMWSKVNQLLGMANPTNCEPNSKTVMFLKKNLVYCFDATLRSQLKDTIDQFELEFFHNQQQQQDRERPSFNQKPELSERKERMPRLSDGKKKERHAPVQA